MKTKKLLALLLTMVFALGIFAGCGESGTASTDDTSSEKISGTVSTDGSTSMEKVIGAL